MVELSGLPRDRLAPGPKVNFPWPLAGRITLPGLSTRQNAFCDSLEEICLPQNTFS